MQLSSNKWHTLEIVDALSIVESSEKGLTEEEAGKRLSRYGPNRLSPPKKRGPLERLAAQFKNVLIYVLVAAAGITVGGNSERSNRLYPGRQGRKGARSDTYNAF
jgi:magnesium-transporting ATPase (P-type)